jgi:hypothetical protein
MTTYPIALDVKAWLKLQFRLRTWQAMAEYYRRHNAAASTPTPVKHDMELAQEDYETCGLRYANVTCADLEAFERERVGEVPLHNDRNRGHYQPSEPDEVYYPDYWWIEGDEGVFG